MEVDKNKRAKENGARQVKPTFQRSTDGRTFDGLMVPTGGLTKRELFAAMAMQGLCVRAHPQYEDGPCNAAIAERAVVLADALLLALEDGK